MKPYFIFLIALGLASCKYKLFRAGSASMEETIKTGQKVGIALTDSFARNDIVAFNYFGPDYTSPAVDNSYQLRWQKRIYRLIAESGDSVEIKEGNVFVNGKRELFPATGKLLYKVETKGNVDELTDPDMRPELKPDGHLLYTVLLTPVKAREFENRKPFFISVQRTYQPDLPNDTSFARQSSAGNWSVDNYGPFKIPSPGEMITVDETNWKFYHNIPAIQKGNNLVREKLYFLLGDNRYRAEDSRFIGLVAHSKMYGVIK